MNRITDISTYKSEADQEGEEKVHVMCGHETGSSLKEDYTLKVLTRDYRHKFSSDVQMRNGRSAA
jgi:hypothetical protein